MNQFSLSWISTAGTASAHAEGLRDLFNFSCDTETKQTHRSDEADSRSVRGGLKGIALAMCLAQRIPASLSEAGAGWDSPLGTASSLLWVLPLLGTPSLGQEAWAHFSFFTCWKEFCRRRGRNVELLGPALPWGNPALSSLARGAVGAGGSSPHQAALLPWNMELQAVLGAALAGNALKIHAELPPSRALRRP